MNMPKGEYYSIQEIAVNYNITEELVRTIIKKGILKAVYLKGELRIPKEDFPEYMMEHYRKPLNLKAKRSLADELRGGLVNLIVVILIPSIALIIYIKLVGTDYFSTETGGLIGIAIVVISAFVSYVGYGLLFPKYSDDLPDHFV